MSTLRKCSVGYPIKFKVKILKLVTFFSIVKLNFEANLFACIFLFEANNLVHRHLKFLAFLHSKNKPKICKIDKMSKNHFSRAEKGSQGVELGVLGAVWISKSGLGILIRAPEVPFFCTPKTAKKAISPLAP